MSIRSLLGNWIAQHNQLLWFRSNGQRLERSQVAHNCLPLAIVGAQETHSMIRADPTPSEPTFPSLTRVPGETELQQPDDGITQRCDPLPFPFDRRTCKSWIVREGMSVPRRARLRLRPRVRFLENSTSGPTYIRGCRSSAS